MYFILGRAKFITVSKKLVFTYFFKTSYFKQLGLGRTKQKFAFDKIIYTPHTIILKKPIIEKNTKDLALKFACKQKQRTSTLAKGKR